MSTVFSHNYPLKPFQERDPRQLRLVIEAFPLATVISQRPRGHSSALSNLANDLAITQVPLILYPERQSMGTLIGHMDRNNPHTAFLDGAAAVTALFHGPNAYITPKIYPGDHYPGWNYVTVQVQGHSTIIHSHAAVKDSLVRMTEFLEWDREPYVLDRDSPGVDRLAQYIVAFEIAIVDIKGIFKLAQDKGHEAAQMAKQHLIARSQTGCAAILEHILPSHGRSE